MSLPLLTLLLTLGADEPLPADKAAIILRDQAAAQARVNAKYGDKKSSELTQEERRQMVKDQLAADREVLDKHGVDAKQWARESIQRSRSEYAELKEAKKELAEKDKAAAEAAKKAGAEEKEITVQRGFSDANPVVLEEKQNTDGTIPVENGLPAEAAQEQEAAGGPVPNFDEMKAPAKSSKGGRRR